MRPLVKIHEPLLRFAYDQAVEDPRDGLTLFGPLDAGKPYGIRAGVIGTPAGIEKFTRWVDCVQRPTRTPEPEVSRPPFPGFESAYRIPWTSAPVITRTIDEEELYRRLFLDDRHQRVFNTVGLYAEAILAARDEDVKPDVWFVIIPDAVKKYCRPHSVVEPEVRQQARRLFSSPAQAKQFFSEPSLFAEQNVAAEPYFYKEHFRDQLKAKLLTHRIATQVLQEGTLENIATSSDDPREKNRIRRQSEIAWNICTAAFYKSGGRPWKVAGIREGVCYIGLVYKKDDRGGDNRSACCGAQMFLDSGDGVVFKGAVGPWYNTETKNFHLSRTAARELAALALKSYKERQTDNRAPREVFLHGQAAFDREEWRGFEEAIGSETTIVGVTIRDNAGLKLFRKTDNPVLRGIAYIRDDRNAFLWTRGWTPRLQTYPGRETPNPLGIQISQGTAPIETVLNDILALTKLNYNTCIFGDGKPITLKFAHAVGEVLTAGPVDGVPPLPFMYYI